jgi:hypothetical protein
MARALLGYVGTGIDQQLSLEVVRLRRRVTELENELAELRASHRAELELELHQFSEDAQTVLA